MNSSQERTISFWFVPLCFLFLFFGVLANQGLHNFTVFLSVVVCAVYLCSVEKKIILQFFKYFSFFYILIFSYIIFYLAINAYHLGFGSEDFLYSVRRARWFLLMIFSLPAFCVFYNNNGLDNKNLVNFFLLTFVFVSFVVVLDSLLRFFLGYYNIAKFFGGSHLGVERPGWLYNPMLFAKISFFYSLFSLFLCFYCSNKVYKFFFAVLFFSWFVVCILTQVRGAWIGIIVSFVFVFFATRFFSFRLSYCFLVIPFVIAIFIFVVFKDRVEDMVFLSTYSEKYRLEHWRANLYLSLDNPFWGVGYGANRSPELMLQYVVDKSFSYGQPHNQYLDILVAVGYPVFFIYTLILLMPVYYAMKTLPVSNGVQAFALFVCIMFNVFMWVAIFFDRIGSIGWLCLVLTWFLIFSLRMKSQKIQG